MKVKVKGFRELEKALAEELPKATARNVLKRTATNSMERIRTRMSALAPKKTGTLSESMKTEPVAATRARGQVRFDRSKGVSVLTGPAPVGILARYNAGWQERGTVEMPPNSYARPAADQEGENVIQEVREELALQVNKAKDRIARKMARAGARG